MSRHLVTTAVERTWPLDRPVLFLGEWCRHYERVAVWSRLDAVVAPPFGLAEDERAVGVETMRGTAAQLLPELTSALNALHGTTYSTRYWEIVLGHWLLRCVGSIYHRYGAVVRALAWGAPDATTVLALPRYQLATHDSETYKWACNDDLWSHVLYGRILADVGAIALEIVDDPSTDATGFGRDAAASDLPPLGARARFAQLTSRILPAFSRDTDAVLVSTYLPLKARLALELRLGQFPQVWRSPAVAPAPADPSMRARLRLPTGEATGFERFLRQVLPELIPTCYLEGYSAMRERAAELPWPKRPRFIYAANNWDTDELFKVWTAAQVERGTPYITGQHGNNYGTHIWAGNTYWPERSTADRFLTWGWTDDPERDVPAFNFRVPGRRSPAMTPDGGLLLVELTLPHRTAPYDVVAEHSIYQDEQFEFVDALPAPVRDHLTVRLYGEFRRHPWADDRRWADRFPTVALERGQAPFDTLVSQSRLVMHSYDSTGILEGLALDTPLMAFWHGGLSHLLPEARPWYDLLRRAGIVHDSPQAAAAAVAARWDDVDGWWRSEEVQRARREFCERYSRQVANPVSTLRGLLVGARGRGESR